MTETPDETPIAELFATNPLKLSDADINQIITKLRGQRKAFVAGNTSAGKPASRKTKSDKLQEKAAALVPDLNLDDLGI